MIKMFGFTNLTVIINYGDKKGVLLFVLGNIFLEVLLLLFVQGYKLKTFLCEPCTIEQHGMVSQTTVIRTVIFSLF